MKINGTSVSSIFGRDIQYLDYSLPQPSYSHAVTVSSGDYKIVNKKGTVGIHNIQVRFGLNANKEDSYKIASKIVSLLRDAYVDFGGDLTYRVTVAVDGSLSYKTDYLTEYALQLQVLEKMGAEVKVITTSASPIVLNNVGTYKTPIIIEVTPTTSIASFSVYGFGAHRASSPLVVNSPTMNKKTILDGVSFRVLQEGVSEYTEKFASTNLITFPEIPVGESTLVFSPSNLNIRIIYNPRYI